MSRNLLVALALAVLSLAVAAPAHAVLITVNFTVTGAANDPNPANAGQNASGSFSFDSSIIPGTLPGSVPDPAVTNFDFTWDGTTWDDTNTSFFASGLSFDAGGNLVAWGLGGDPGGESSINGEVADPDDFWLQSPPFSTQFAYHNLGVNDFFYGSLTWSTTTGSEAPEPGTLALFAPGLLALGLIRRRRVKA